MPQFYGALVKSPLKLRALIGNYITYKIMDVIAYPYPNIR